MKATLVDQLGYGGYRAMILVLRLFPLRACFALGWLLGGLAYFVAGKYRRLAQRNLRIAFDGEKSEREIRRLSARHFRNLGANLLCSLRFPGMKPEDILKVVDLREFHETVLGEGINKKPAVVAISHFGNWEAWAQIVPSLPWPVLGTLYQRLGNPLIDAHVRDTRRRFNLETFERKDGFPAPVKHLKNGGLLGLLMDQHAGDAGLWTPLFGRLASTSPLAALLALRSHSNILPATVNTVGWARWKIVLQPLVQTHGQRDIGRITAHLNKVLETQIRQNPQDWFWVHNRWKTPRPDFLLSRYKRGVHLPDTALKPFRILIRSSNWLGDCVMTIPAVRAIKQGRPDARVTILAQAKLGDFWRRIPWVDEVLEITPNESVFSVGRKLRKQNFDVGILFPNSLRTALEMFLGKIPRRVGYEGHGRRLLLNQIIRPREKQTCKPQHQVHHYLRIAHVCGASAEDTSVAIPRNVTQGDDGAPLEIGICPGAEYGAAKRWIPERFAEAAMQIKNRRECRFVLFGVAKERALGASIASCLGDACENLIGQTSLDELMNRLARCHVLLTNDTGTMHLATLLGVPVVAIFGSTEPKLTGPLGEGHQVLRRQVECSPCFLRECPLDFRCMKTIEVEEVVEAVIRKLEFQTQHSPPETSLTS